MGPLNGNSPARSDAASPTAEEKRRELDDLLQSGIVRERTQLHSLLLYLGGKALEDPPKPLKEYVIGLDALSKPEDYDPRIDPTVRVEVAKLRKRLNEYYEGPGATHRIRLTIPKGGYLPVFVTVEEPVGVSAASGPRWIRIFFPALSATLLLILIVVLWKRDRTSVSLPAEVEQFWAPHLQGPTPTLVVYGAPLFLKVDNSFFRDTHVNRSDEMNQSPQVRGVLDVLKPKEVRPIYHFTGLGEAEAIFHVTRVLAARSANLSVKCSSDVGWDDLKNTHVVMIGGRKFNPQIPELPFKPRFTSAKGRIIDSAAAGGEQAEYLTVRKSAHGDVTEDYAVVSVYPGFSHGTRVVTLESTSTEGTLAAAEFVSRPDMLREVLSRGVPVSGSAPVRPFQIILGAKLNSGVVVGLSFIRLAILP